MTHSARPPSVSLMNPFASALNSPSYTFTLLYDQNNIRQPKHGRTKQLNAQVWLSQEEGVAEAVRFEQPSEHLTNITSGFSERKKKDVLALTTQKWSVDKPGA